MSKNNKVNRDHYTQRGRLTPDEAAREQAKQRQTASPARTEGKTPPFQAAKPRVTTEDAPAPDDEETATAESQEENTGADKRLD